MGLNLLHAISTVNPSAGGPIEGLRQLTACNHLYGHTVEVVSLDSPDDPWVKKFELPIHATGPSVGNYGYSEKYVPWMRKNGGNYDAVIVNGVWNYNCYGSWLALRKMDVPYMVFTHGMLDPWFKHRFPLKHLKKWLYWPWGLYPVLRDADAVFFTCERERILARDSFWLYDCHEVIIRYGTAGIPDAERDYRPDFLAEHPSLAETQNFLFFGRVHPKKGPDLLIRAVVMLKKAGIWDDRKMRVVIAGPNDSEYGEELKALARKEGVENSIYWTGMLLGDQKWGAIQAADVFVLPSHQENFGIAVAEALSAKIPVLISHSVNISPEIAVDGAGLADDDTADGTYRLLRKWIGLSQAEKQEMRLQARQTFLDRFRAETGAKDMMRSIYLTLAARKMVAASKEESLCAKAD